MFLLGSFAKFITDREAVRVRRASGAKPPWTDDPILASYRFCNINREHDPVTIGIRQLYAKVPPGSLWFHLVVARLFNHLPTLTEMGRLDSKDWRRQIATVADDREQRGERVFNPAYIVSTNGHAIPKVKYLTTNVLMPLAKHWGSRALAGYTTCEQWSTLFLAHNGLGDFMTNQIVTDMKYTVLLPRETTPDWTTYCLAGPGTRRGLNCLFARPAQRTLGRRQAYDELLKVRVALAKHPLIGYFDDLNNLANSFCEFSKYRRVVDGEGTPKQRYQPAEPSRNGLS